MPRGGICEERRGNTVTQGKVCVWLGAAGLAAAALLGGAACLRPPEPFKRNPHLRPLLSEQAAIRHYSFYPVASDSARLVYFLRVDRSDIHDFWAGGMLWSVGLHDTSAQEILPGTYCALSLSPSQRELAVAAGSTTSGGLLLLLDLQTREIDTVPTSRTDIFDVQFSRIDPELLFYCSKNGGVLSVRRDGTEETLIDGETRQHFTLSPRDSIVVQDPYYNPKPSMSPSGHALVIPVFVSDEEGDDLLLVSSGTTDSVRLHANPFRRSILYFPAWLLGEEGIVLAADEVYGRQGSRTAPGNLWVLESLPRN